MFLKYLLCGASNNVVTPDVFATIIPNTPPEKEPPTVLIIDDSLVYAKLVSKFMQQKGYNTFVAINGYEGLQCVSTLYFDLVISDIHMPVMDGLEFVKTLRKNIEQLYQLSYIQQIYICIILHWKQARLISLANHLQRTNSTM